LPTEQTNQTQTSFSLLADFCISAPVWTAFINYKMISRRWMRRVEPRKVYLNDLERYVFSYTYKPQLGPHGEHELCFRDAAGE